MLPPWFPPCSPLHRTIAGRTCRLASAPAGLSGKQFILEEIDSSGIREEVTLIFREGDVFDAARSAAKGAAGEDTGSYTYHRTGPYTGTWTIRSSGPGLPDCTAHLAFTSPASGAYTGSCADGSRRTGSFQVVHEDPYCSSLWDGLACATAANLPQVYVGASGANTASTEVVLSNTDPDPSECEVALLFHRGTSQAPPVRFNGRPEEGNLIHVTISREGAAIVTLTAPEASGLLSGAVYVYARSPCTADSLEVQGRTLIEGSDGTIEELLSLASQSPRDWLGDGDCRVLTGVFGNGRNLGFAAVAAQPGGAAPGGARFRFRSFDAGGRFIGAPAGGGPWRGAGTLLALGVQRAQNHRDVPGGAGGRQLPGRRHAHRVEIHREPGAIRCGRLRGRFQGGRRRPPGAWRGLEEGIRQASMPRATARLPSPLLPVSSSS